jgi:uncharacterized membrane protein YccC
MKTSFVSGSSRRGHVDWRHGTRLAIAVVFAFGVSALLGLPESFWAVMSALIVVRPTAGSTLGAGWDRVRGTLGGTITGLVGVWLLHGVRHGDTTATGLTLAIVAALAFASAVVPGLRSAPLSALIVLNSGGIPGHSAVDVAELRALEIAIGVASGIALSLAFATHARERFVATSAAWLRESGTRAMRAEEPPEVRDAHRERTRSTLREIAELAVGADREARWLGRFGRSKAPPINRVAAARVMTRIASDIGAIERAAGCAPRAIDDATRAQIGDAIASACAATADALDGTPLRRAALAPLKRWSTADEMPVAWIAPGATLLLQDLGVLARLLAPRDEAAA